MADEVEAAVERTIITMRERLGESLTIDDMARTALFSKYHFSRVFLKITGVSPGRFLAALRVEEAKRLLLSTSLNVAEISLRVGYSSVGTFSWRFTRSVGVPPIRFRRLGGYTSRLPQAAPNTTHSGCIRGRVSAPVAGVEQIFLGLFRRRVPEGRPVRCVVLDEPGPYRLDHVPEGGWYVLAHAVAAGADGLPAANDADLYVGSFGPLTMRHSVTLTGADLPLGPMSTLDPPVLMALLDYRRTTTANRRRTTPAA